MGGIHVFWAELKRKKQCVLHLSFCCFLLSLNRISWNFVGLKDIHVLCRCAYPQEILIHFLFLGVTPFLNWEIWSKWKILLKQFVSATPLKPLIRISWNFVVIKDIVFRLLWNQPFNRISWKFVAIKEIIWRCAYL